MSNIRLIRICKNVYVIKSISSFCAATLWRKKENKIYCVYLTCEKKKKLKMSKVVEILLEHRTSIETEDNTSQAAFHIDLSSKNPNRLENIT